MPGDGLNTYLEEQHGVGASDSDGAFTISWQQAREKLAQFALPDPRHYVLNLVASAVAGGTRRLRFEQTSTKLVFSYSGRTFSEFELLHLWNHLLQPKDRVLEELAVALNTARRLPGAVVTLESWSAQTGGCRLVLWGEEHQVERLERPTDSSAWLEGTNVLTVEESGTVGKMVRWVRGTPEFSLLIKHAVFGAAPLILGGQEVGQPVRVGVARSSGAWRHFRHDGFPLELRSPNPEYSKGCVRSRRDSPGEFSAVLTLGKVDDCQQDGLTVLLNGISFLRPARVLGYPVFSGVISLAHLRKNVSHTNLANNQTYKDLLQLLRQLGEELFLERIRHPKALPLELLDDLLESSGLLSKSFRARSELTKAAEVDLWVKEVRYSRNLQDLSLWRELLQELERYKPSGKKAMAMELRLAGIIRRAAGERFRLGRIGEVANLWVRLVELGQARNTDWESTESGTLSLLRYLAGLENQPTGCLEPEEAALVARLLGKPKEALPLSEAPHSVAQVYLALWDFERAEEVLRHQLDAEISAPVAETLSDLLAFAPPKGKERRSESLHWKKLAMELRANEWPEWERFFSSDLSRIATPGWSERLRYSIRLSSPLSAEIVALITDLEAGRLLNLKGEPGAVAIKSALLAAERKWPMGHPVLTAARVKAVHLLRSAQLWREADDILARESLLRVVEKRMSVLD